MKAKIVAAMLVTVLFVSGLTGCSESGETTAEGIVQESAEAESGSSEAAESVKRGKERKALRRNRRHPGKSRRIASRGQSLPSPSARNPRIRARTSTKNPS